MEQSQNTSQRRNYLIAGLVVVLIIGYFLFQRQEAKAPQTSEDSEEQTSEENTNSAQTESETSENTNSSSSNQDQTTTSSSENPSGNVAATGTLQVSDDLSRGSLMMDSNRGKIYVQTNRDFSDLVGKEVTLSAQGNINSFVFLGFQPGSASGTSGTVAGTDTTDTSAVGGGDTVPAGVQLSGTLGQSDNETRGNYLINSASGKIYLKSQHDYSAWLGSDVELTANGTIDSYTGAVLNKK